VYYTVYYFFVKFNFSLAFHPILFTTCDAMKNTATTETAAPFLTAAELQKRWRVSAMYLHRLRAAGRLSVMRIGKRAVRYALAEVLKIEAESIA
jgi:hypothetical protein